jgi:hypothetical protein
MATVFWTMKYQPVMASVPHIFLVILIHVHVTELNNVNQHMKWRKGQWIKDSRMLEYGANYKLMFSSQSFNPTKLEIAWQLQSTFVSFCFELLRYV